jgi:hypothetical protein
MAENRERQVGTKRAGWRGRVTGLAGLGAAAVAILMMAYPAAGAVGPALLLHAPYKGAAYAPSNNVYTTGCAAAKVTKPWVFHLKTGIGGAVDSGIAVACKKTAANVGTYSDASVGGGFSLAIPVKIGGGSHSVGANVAYKLAGLLKANDGLTSGVGACNYGINNYWSTYADYNWNYNGAYFPNYNDSGTYKSSSGYSYSYSYGTPTPSPFNMNNTTASYVGYSYGGYGACEARATFSLSADAQLMDINKNAPMNQTGNTLETCTTFFGFTYCNPAISVEVSIVNTTSWGCYAYTDWYGPTNKSTVQPLTCYTYNKTLTSTVAIYYPISSSSITTGTANNASLTLPSSGSGTMWWNDTFNGKHHYYLVVMVNAYADAYDTWKKGSASWTLNIGTLGNGIALTGISVT